MLSQILTACAGFSWWIETTIASVFLFGEYPYPSEEDFNN